jgi:putative transposase
MEERGIEVDHSTLNRWLDQQFRAGKRPVGSSRRLDETNVKVKGCWKYLYRAVDKVAAQWTSCWRPSGIAKPRCGSYARRSVLMAPLRRSRSTRAAPTRLRSKATTRNRRRTSKSVRSNNIVEDQRAVKRVPRPMLGFNPFLVGCSNPCRQRTHAHDPARARCARQANCLQRSSSMRWQRKPVHHPRGLSRPQRISATEPARTLEFRTCAPPMLPAVRIRA